MRVLVVLSAGSRPCSKRAVIEMASEEMGGGGERIGVNVITPTKRLTPTQVSRLRRHSGRCWVAREGRRRPPFDVPGARSCRTPCTSRSPQRTHLCVTGVVDVSPRSVCPREPQPRHMCHLGAAHDTICRSPVVLTASPHRRRRTRSARASPTRRALGPRVT